METKDKLKHCDKCLCYYTGEHKCDWLMRELVEFHKRKEVNVSEVLSYEAGYNTALQDVISKIKKINWSYIYKQEIIDNVKSLLSNNNL